jgi:hypothetical protein
MEKRAFSNTSQAVSSRGGREWIFFADPCCVDGDTISSLDLFCCLADVCELVVASARPVSRQVGQTLKLPFPNPLVLNWNSHLVHFLFCPDMAGDEREWSWWPSAFSPIPAGCPLSFPQSVLCITEQVKAGADARFCSALSPHPRFRESARVLPARRYTSWWNR